MSLATGTKLGSYEILGPLGAGGMGEVYRARDTKLKRDVALKVIPDSFATDPDRLARFTREAQALASLNHPNIAHIHGLEESESVTAIVMELVEGDDLSQRIARGAIPLEEALPIARQIAEALEAAHEQGIIHRDLKPANIKVRPDGTVKVLDFGLAKALDPAGASNVDAMNSPTLTARATQMGLIIGTAAYMAPEQAKGRPVDKRADIWAFGAVLNEMLTGRRLFDAEDVSETLAAVLTRDVSLTSLPAELWGGFWTADDQIIFGTCCRAETGTAGLFRVAASGGGVAAPLTRIPEGERSHGYPVLLPDGKHFLYSRGVGVSVGSLDAASEQQASTKLLPDRTNVAYVPSGVRGKGFVLFVREATLYAQPFDEGRRELAGEPQPVAQHASLADPDQFWLFSAAGNGVLICQQDGFLQNRQRLWLDRHGQTLRPAGEPGFFGGVTLSPDGLQAAYGRREGQHEDLWLTDVERRSDERFTTNAARNWNATWSPDASHIAYASTQGGGTTDLYLKAVAGAGGEALILKNAAPLDWSSDGKYVLFGRDRDLWLLGDPRALRERTPVRLTDTKFGKADGRLWEALDRSPLARRSRVNVMPPLSDAVGAPSEQYRAQTQG
jgi:serine/threonine protein kinase